MSTLVVTFDAGQTLVDLDLDFLVRRLGERGATTTAETLGRAAPAAWAVHDRQVEAGVRHPWREFMTALLEGAELGVPVGDLVEWLWQEQPRQNLWRRPIADMVALARELATAGVRVAVLSNSEGRIAELLATVGIADPFAAIIDSGRLGIAKPDPAIFAHTLATLGALGARAIHIGDSWAADVEGALGAGWRAIWYGPGVTPVADPRVAVARDAAEARAALVAWGVLPRR